MKRKKNNDIIILGISGLVFVISIIVIIVYYAGSLGETDNTVIDDSNNIILNDNDSNNTNNTNNNTNNESNKKKDEQINGVYKVGDYVTLVNHTSWSVMANTNKDNQYVTLISDENINDSYRISYKKASEYLSTTYKNNLIKRLKASADEIKEVRLINLNDISKLTGISVNQLVPGKVIENKNTPLFLYEGDTITSNTSNGLPIMICTLVSESTTNDPGRICLGEDGEYFDIRPVITISKKYIVQE